MRERLFFALRHHRSVLFLCLSRCVLLAQATSVIRRWRSLRCSQLIATQTQATQQLSQCPRLTARKLLSVVLLCFSWCMVCACACCSGSYSPRSLRCWYSTHMIGHKRDPSVAFTAMFPADDDTSDLRSSLPTSTGGLCCSASLAGVHPLTYLSLSSCSLGTLSHFQSGHTHFGSLDACSPPIT
jgi:hypothetical protein